MARAQRTKIFSFRRAILYSKDALSIERQLNVIRKDGIILVTIISE